MFYSSWLQIMQRTFHDNFISTPVDSYFIRMIVLYTYECNITAINRRVMWREQFSSFITPKDKKWPSWWRAYATESSPALSRVNNSNCYNIPLKSAKTSGYDGKRLYACNCLPTNKRDQLKCARTCKTSPRGDTFLQRKQKHARNEG